MPIDTADSNAKRVGNKAQLFHVELNFEVISYL